MHAFAVVQHELAMLPRSRAAPRFQRHSHELEAVTAMDERAAQPAAAVDAPAVPLVTSSAALPPLSRRAPEPPAAPAAAAGAGSGSPDGVGPRGCAAPLTLPLVAERP
jgi:hypothetical protein